MKFFRQYLLVGGMPQAIVEFIKTNDYTKVDQVKRDILNLYWNDISKFAQVMNIRFKCFWWNTGQLSKHEKKFTLTSLEKGARFRDYEEAFIWLDEAMITNLCFNSTDPTVGLSLYKDRLTLKMYMADTGLLITHAFNGDSVMHQKVAKAIVNDRLEFNKGMILKILLLKCLEQTIKTIFLFKIWF